MRSWLLMLVAFCFSIHVFSQAVVPPLGYWREHLPYNNIIDLAVSGKYIFAATPYSLFSVNRNDYSIDKWSKIQGLSETGISAICFDSIQQQLVIAYTNSNIDLLGEQAIRNIPDLKRLNSGGDKSVYHIYYEGNTYYFSTGFGLLLADAQKAEIKTSWRIGNNGTAVKTTGFCTTASAYYAATTEGLKKCVRNAGDPANFSNWQMVSGSNGLPLMAADQVVLFNQKIVTLEGNTLYTEEAAGWKPFFTSDWPVTNINVSGNRILLCQRALTGESKITVLDANGLVVEVVQQQGLIDQPQKAVWTSNGYWIADLTGGLSQRDQSGAYFRYIPSSPQEKASGQVLAANGNIYIAAGEVNDSWNYQYNPFGIYTLSDGNWTNYNRYHFPVFDSLLDFISVAVDPADASLWAGSFGGGLLHIKNGDLFEVFKQQSALQPATGDPGSYRVSGLAFDQDHNLWISNYGAPRPLVVKLANDTWQAFTLPWNINGNALADILLDDAGQLWIISPMRNGLMVFNHGGNITNTADDRWRLFTNGTATGNLPSANILAIAKDKSGFIWVGTDNGMAVIQCPENVFSAQGCEAYLPVVPGAFNGYLFKGEEVRSIAVDGADRKWVATGNGVWLISADGEKVILHFTENNSPLLSNDVRKLAIEGRSGEVFFATAKGICSYRGSATEASDNGNGLQVFPNPVPPSFQGQIAIRNVPENAIVKITELNGRLVFQTRALGGQAVWNGRDYKGGRIASGVYLVLINDGMHKEKMAGKIFFISK